MSVPFFFHLHCECLVRGHLYMPDQRHELHHKICNLRYGTLGYGMDPYEGMAKINLHSQSKLIITSVNRF